MAKIRRNKIEPKQQSKFKRPLFSVKRLQYFNLILIIGLYVLIYAIR